MRPGRNPIRPIDDAELREVLDGHARYRSGKGGGRRADLSYRELSNRLFDEVDLGEAVLTGAVLASAMLGRCNLEQAVLFGADLHDADLRGARLARADLRGACLRGANLSGADLTACDLREGVIALHDLRGRPADHAAHHGRRAGLRRR